MKRVLKISLIAIAFSLLFAFSVQFHNVSLAMSNEELKQQLMNENEDNPESIEYLVTDTFISRVAPETTIENFKANFSEGEEVKVYEDEACTKEVENGYVYSGMYAKYELNGRVFKISVLGDINSIDKEENNILGDGILNQIELTRIIRDHVKTEGWEIKETEELQSADVTCDKNVNLDDVNSIIKYIVFGGLEIPDVKIVESPKVEVIEGEQDENGYYIGSVKIKITQINNKEETLKTIYKITGTQNKPYEEINQTEEIIELKGEGVYKVTGYSYGLLENKSKGSNKIIEIVEPSIKNYKIEHYLESLEKDENNEPIYTLKDTENLYGAIGDTVRANARTYTGFTFDESNSNNIKEAIIKNNEDIVLKLYYSRNSYILTLNKNDNIEKVILPNGNVGNSVYETVKYEENINIDAELKNIAGYNCTWDVWTSSDNNLVEDQTSKQSTIKMPAANIILTANGNKEIINYNITYVLNDGINNDENPSTYNVESNITLKNPTKEGNTFAGWYEQEDFNVTPTVRIVNRTGDITLYAKWVKNSCKVIVHHYEDGTQNKVADDEELIGEFGDRYETRSLIPTLDSEGNIIETDGRNYLNANKYEIASVTGAASGTYAENNIEVTYYYKVKTFEITGEAKTGGSISSIDETVKYGENSTKDIIVTPAEGNRVKTITVNESEVYNYTVNTDTNVVNMDKFTNVTENKHVVATFEPIRYVAQMIDAPEGYSNLIGKKYEYLSKGLEDIADIDKGKFVLQIIDNVNNESNIVDNKNVTIDLNGFEIKTCNSEKPTLTVESGLLTIIDSQEDGKVINEEGIAIYVKENGTFTLGENDETVSTTKPIIEGDSKGVLKNEGVFNFYDGIIIGKSAIEGGVDATPTSYEPTVVVKNGKQEATLAIVTDIEAIIGTNRYVKLEDAIAAANSDGNTEKVEIDIVKDITKESAILVGSDKNINLDLNGHIVTLSSEDNYVIENSGDLKITDSSKTDTERGTGSIKNTLKSGILNTENGKLDINDIEMNIERGAISHTSTGTTNLNNVKIVADNVFYYPGGTGKITINNCDITTVNEAIYENPYSQEAIPIEINGGSIVVTTYEKNVIDAKDVTLNNVTVTGRTTRNKELLLVKNSLKINGGQYNNKIRSYGTTKIDGGTVEGIVCEGEADIKNATINTLTTQGNSTINNSTINGFGNAGTTGVYNNTNFTNGMSNSGVLTLYSANISKNSLETPAVQNSGTLIIGVDDGNITEDVKINSSKSQGIVNYENGKIKFYDGVIESEDTSIFGEIESIPEHTYIEITKGTDKEIAKLKLVNDVAQVDETRYSTVQDAVDSCGNEEKEVIILSDITLTDNERVNVSENQNIKLNLNGHNITVNSKEYGINNNGSLNILDAEGIIELRADDPAILNNGNLTIGNISLNLNRKTYSYSSEEKYIIENSKVLNYSANIDSKYNAIKNNEDATLNIQNGEIICYNDTAISNEGTIIVNNGYIYGTTGINNSSEGEVTVNGGTIEGTYDSIRGYTPISSEGIVHLKGGTLKGKVFARGTVYVEGSTIESEVQAIDNYGDLYISSGLIKSTYNSQSYAAIMNYSKLEMTGGTVNATQTNAIKNANVNLRWKYNFNNRWRCNIK